jgi:NADP-dependent 3-hydroxy acid dehydrogenase YdfG
MTSIALVTGGSRGIGKMIAAGFLAQGAAKVYITAREAAPCEATARELAAEYGAECIALPIDISTLAGIEMLAGEIKKFEPRLDILVNNAGAAWGADFDEFPEGGWDKVVPQPEDTVLADQGARRAAARGRLRRGRHKSSTSPPSMALSSTRSRPIPMPRAKRGSYI